MDKKKVLLYGFISIAIVVLLLIEIFKEKPVDWNYSFENSDKIPFGCYILYHMLDDIFPGESIVESKQGLYDFLEMEELRKQKESNFIFMSYHFNIDKFVMKKLLNYASRGNNVFIAANELSKELKDTLNLRLKWVYTPKPFVKKDSTILTFTNPALNNEKYIYTRGIQNVFINSFDTSKVTVLGKIRNLGVNFIKHKLGDGYIYIHSNPLVFTNINFVETNNAAYVSKALSYLPVKKTFWDEFYKPLRKAHASPLSYVLSQPSLKAAYLLLLVGLVLLLLFQSKRRQRAIPVVEPKKNTTPSFVKTLSSLYFYKKNHGDIAHKKYNHFLEHLRDKYYMKTSSINDEFIEELSYKTGIVEEELKDIFSRCKKLLDQPTINEPKLHKINSLIESFYIKTK